MHKRILDIALKKCRHKSGSHWEALLTGTEVYTLAQIGVRFFDIDLRTANNFIRSGIGVPANYDFTLNKSLAELVNSCKRREK